MRWRGAYEGAHYPQGAQFPPYLVPPERPLDSAWVGEEPEIVPEQQPETAEPATLVTLGDLYTQLAERLVETEQPYDVEAGLDRLNKWIDGQQQ